MNDRANAEPGEGAPRVAEGVVVSGTLTLDTLEWGDRIERDIPGGSALYASAAASLLLPTRVAGTVGSDFPFELLQPLWGRGVDRSAIEVVEGPTFRWHARYDADGDSRVTLSREPGVAAGRRPPMSGVSMEPLAVVLGSTDPRVQAHVRGACAHAGLVGLDSMRHWWDAQADALRTLLAQVDIVFLDEEELAVASDAPDVARRIGEVHSLGPSTVVIKRGARGASVHRRDALALHGGVVSDTRVADATGAGDAFAGAYVAARARFPERGDAHALRFATAVASFAVESVGVRALMSLDPALLARRMHALELREG